MSRLPFKSFLFMFTVCKFEMLNRLLGTGPPSRVFSSARVVNDVIDDIHDGKLVELKLLLLRSRVLRTCIPVRFGNAPFRLLLDKLSSPTLARLLNPAGTEPVSAFLSNRKTSKVTTWDSEGGMGPVSLLLSNSTWIKVMLELNNFVGIDPVN